MALASEEECAACKASRKRVVDAFFDGYFGGSLDAIADDNVTKFCLVHEQLLTKLILERDAFRKRSEG
jgi:hypothetical protein